MSDHASKTCPIPVADERLASEAKRYARRFGVSLAEAQRKVVEADPSLDPRPSHTDERERDFAGTCRTFAEQTGCSLRDAQARVAAALPALAGQSGPSKVKEDERFKAMNAQAEWGKRKAMAARR